jgi:hypothetical protein
MRLTNELRNLEGRKRLHRDKRLKTACHEACHCLIALKVGMPFIRVEVGAQTLKNARWHCDAKPETVDIDGRVVMDVEHKVRVQSADAAAQVSLAGYAFQRIVDPHSNGFVAMLSGADVDMRQAIEWIRWKSEGLELNWNDIEIEEYVDELTLEVRQHLIANWSTVMRLGQALAEAGSLEFTQVRSVIGEKR